MKKNEATVSAISKKVIACMYFPGSTPDSAVRQLMRWIHLNPELQEKLNRTFYKSKQRLFTPMQYYYLCYYLGDPEALEGRMKETGSKPISPKEEVEKMNKPSKDPVWEPIQSKEKDLQRVSFQEEGAAEIQSDEAKRSTPTNSPKDSSKGDKKGTRTTHQHKKPEKRVPSLKKKIKKGKSKETEEEEESKSISLRDLEGTRPFSNLPWDEDAGSDISDDEEWMDDDDELDEQIRLADLEALRMAQKKKHSKDFPFTDDDASA